MASPIQLTNDDDAGLEAGLYKYWANIATGPIVFQTSFDGGTTFINETDGNIAATETGVIYIGQGEVFRATIPGGDTLHVAPVGRG